MTKTTLYHTPNGALAVHQSAGDGRPIVMVHGNSSSARAFSRQLEGSLGRRRRVVAIDLLGHGRAENASDAAAYLLPGHALALVAIAGNFGLDQAVFVGWSLGGHILLEAAKDLPRARGFAIYGAPPSGSAGDGRRVSSPTRAGDRLRRRRDAPASGSLRRVVLRPRLRRTFPTSSSKTRCAPTAGRERKSPASMAPGVSRDEVQVVAGLKQPLAVLHGAQGAVRQRRLSGQVDHADPVAGRGADD